MHARNCSGPRALGHARRAAFRLREGEDCQRIHAHARVVDLELAVAAINYVEDAVDGERRLGDVGCDDDLGGIANFAGGIGPCARRPQPCRKSWPGARMAEVNRRAAPGSAARAPDASRKASAHHVIERNISHTEWDTRTASHGTPTAAQRRTASAEDILLASHEDEDVAGRLGEMDFQRLLDGSLDVILTRLLR
eukprot:1559368-Prymnesium_polylepis.1